jgi:hypothetical protein
MKKVIGAACVAIFLLTAASAQSGQFSKYKSVEAYEIQPGILMMPSYTRDGQVCEIGLEKRHYSRELIRTGSASFSNEEIDKLVDELAPESVRGPRTSAAAGRNSITIGSQIITATRNYENVAVSVYSEKAGTCRGAICTQGNAAVSIQWKNRKCE